MGIRSFCSFCLSTDPTGLRFGPPAAELWDGFPLRRRGVALEPGARAGHARRDCGSRFQFEQAVRLKPDFADARLDYGRLLADRGELAAAISQLEAAVRLQPDLWRAHFELGMALGRSGNPTAAAEQLRIAANGSDPQVRADAVDVLQRLGR
jgi:tetratricopeptide (TPR) repeat protein